MRALIAAALALLLGVVLGGLGPREDLRAAEARITELEAKECERPVAEGFAALLAAGAASRGGPSGDRPEDPPTPEAQREDGARPDAPPEEAPEADEPRSDVPVSGEARSLDSARAAMEIRRTQARAAMIERADPDDAQLAEFDDALDDMNDELFGLADEVTARLAAGETPERRELMTFAAEALDIVLVADERVQASLSEEQLEALDDAAVDPLSYIDPQILDLLQGLDAP